MCNISILATAMFSVAFAVAISVAAAMLAVTVESRYLSSLDKIEYHRSD